MSEGEAFETDIRKLIVSINFRINWPIRELIFPIINLIAPNSDLIGTINS